MKQTKPDWAERKVAAMFKRWTNGKQEEGWSKPLVRLLKAERQRAVRVCRRVAKASYSKLEGDYFVGYDEACDDCARAIGGKQ